MPCNSDVDDQFNVNTDVTFGYKFSFGFGNGDTTFIVPQIQYIFFNF